MKNYFYPKCVNSITFNFYCVTKIACYRLTFVSYKYIQFWTKELKMNMKHLYGQMIFESKLPQMENDEMKIENNTNAKEKFIFQNQSMN